MCHRTRSSVAPTYIRMRRDRDFHRSSQQATPGLSNRSRETLGASLPIREEMRLNSAGQQAKVAEARAAAAGPLSEQLLTAVAENERLNRQLHGLHTSAAALRQAIADARSLQMHLQQEAADASEMPTVPLLFKTPPPPLPRWAPPPMAPQRACFGYLVHSVSSISHVKAVVVYGRGCIHCS